MIHIWRVTALKRRGMEVLCPCLKMTSSEALIIALYSDSPASTSARLRSETGCQSSAAQRNAGVTGSDFLAIQRTNPALIAEWQRQLGNQLVAPTPARAQQVPEPTAAAICSLLAGAVVALRQFIATR